MCKKILIGSIIAVAILIGVSFTSVVGYRSVDSDVKASPLFNIRSSRAIDEENEDLSCEYIGKGEEINIPIPKRNHYGTPLTQVLNHIKRMDSNDVKRLLEKFMGHREVWMDNLNNIKKDDEADIIDHLRENPLIMNYINNSRLKANTGTFDNDCPSFFVLCPTILEIYPGWCLIDAIVLILGAIFVPPVVLAVSLIFLIFVSLGIFFATLLFGSVLLLSLFNRCETLRCYP